MARNALALSMTRDKTGFFFLSIYQADGVTPQDLSGGVLYFHAAYAPISFTIDKDSNANGIVITNLAGGLNCAQLTIEPGDTVAIPQTGLFSIPAELTLAISGSDFELARGTLAIYPNVSTP